MTKKTALNRRPDLTAGRRPAHKLLVTCSLLFVLAGQLCPLASAATLEPEVLESREGYFQLRWDTEGAIRLVESTDADFTARTAIYTGSDTGHVASGKPDGIWYYRIESADGTQVLSNVSRVTVNHHPLQRAFTFFGIGAIVFLATLGLIVFARPDSDERS